jgi:Uma2 family endonuclease
MEERMPVQPQRRYTPEEYLTLERKAEYKSEYVNGEIFAMSGASERHNVIVLNIGASLHAQFRHRPCRVYASDMRVKVSQTGLYTYPDIVALCGEPQFDDAQKDTLLNPAVIIEVLSPSTEAYDRGGKFEHYRKLASLAEYLLVSQEKPHLEQYVRQPDNLWLLSEASSLQNTVHLPSIDCSLSVADVYEKVEFGT